MFSLLISGIIPASSTALPLIVTYFTTLMCMCTMSVVATVVVLALHHKNAKNHTMPSWVRQLIVAISRACASDGNRRMRVDEKH